MTAWQPIETAPRDGARVLLWPRIMQHTGERRVEIGYWHQPANPNHTGFWVAAGRQITHWQPLPDPPEPQP